MKRLAIIRVPESEFVSAYTDECWNEIKKDYKGYFLEVEPIKVYPDYLTYWLDDGGTKRKEVIEKLICCLGIYDFIEYLEGCKTDELNDNINEGKIIDVTLDIQSNKPSVKSFALYYYFLIESGVEKPFDIAPNGKIKAMEEISKLFKISAGQFRKEYDSINRSNRDKRYSYKNLIDFKNWTNSSNLSAKSSN